MATFDHDLDVAGTISEEGIKLSNKYAPKGHVGATGSAHGVATSGTAGFMSAADKGKLDGIASGATNTPLATAAPQALAASAAVGTSTRAAREDHKHPYPTPAQIGALPATGDASRDVVVNTIEAPGTSSFRVYRLAALSTQSPGWTEYKIPFDVNSDGAFAWDTLGEFNIGTSEFVPLRPGIYFFCARARLPYRSGVNQARISIMLNDADAAAGNQIHALTGSSNSNGEGLVVETLLRLEAGDRVSVTYSYGGSVAEPIATGKHNAYFCGYKLP